MKTNLQIFLYLPILLFFLPAFALYLPGIGGSSVYLYFFIFIYLAIFLFILCDFKNFKFKILHIIKYTPLKYFLMGIVLIIINSTLLSFTGITTFGITIRYTIFRIFLALVPTVVYFVYVIDRFITLNKFYSLFILMFYITLILGIVAFIGQYFDITILNNLFDTLANKRIICMDVMGHYDTTTSNYSSMGLPRLDNLHEEPSFYARFLFLFLPVTYGVAFSKLRFFKNVFLNKIIKLTIIPLTWISLILTQSPIYLVFCCLLSVFYFHHVIHKYIKKHLQIFIFIALFLVILFYYILFIDPDLVEDTYLSRIANVIKSFGSLHSFIDVEPSLGTRIICFICAFKVFLAHPWFGVGIGNLENHILTQYMQFPLLTREIIGQITFAYYNNLPVWHNKNVITNLLSSHGIFIFILLSYAHFKLFAELRTLKKYITEDFDYLICNSMQYCFIAVTIWFFYDSLLLNYEYLVIYSLMLVIIYKWKGIIYKKERGKYEKNNLHG